jgi:sugar/nucleoside kinase (ribokinase family)
MSPAPTASNKPFDVVAVGSWTNVDHLFRVDRLPRPGDTVQILGPIAQVEATYWGGCASNNAAVAAKLGAQSALVSVVGNDFRERGNAAHLQALGVDLRGAIVVEDDLCGHSFLFSDPTGATICLSHLGSAERQDEFEPDPRLLTGAKVVVVNYRFDRFTLRAAQLAAQSGACIIVSGNLATGLAVAPEMVQVADLLVCTRHELDQLMRGLGLVKPAELFALGVRMLVETRGRDGCIVWTSSQEIQIPAVPAQVVDPTGAGDGFVGGLAVGLAFDRSVAEAAQLGAAVASFVIEAVGCQTSLPTFEQAVGRLSDGSLDSLSSFLASS